MPLDWIRGALLFSVASAASVASVYGADDYQRDVKPILRTHCLRCHGPLKAEAGLRLDTRALAVKGGEHGAALVPGDTAASRLVQRITGDDDSRMPPEGMRLSRAEIEILKRWIAAGATAPAGETAEDPRSHWAYQPITRPIVPTVAREDWSRNPVDAFIARLRRQGKIRPRPVAARHVLFRRVSLDLVGLPPSSDELRVFLADTSPDAYLKAVDRLLSSPHYGERWGRHWLDVWRYSDWYGFQDQVRFSQKNIWHWRDWVVESLNADKGYQRMVMEMLAGDEIVPFEPGNLRATGFLVRNRNTDSREQWIRDTVEHTAKAFLAMTIACVQCHDHPYDPIWHDEYYRFRNIFEPVQVGIDSGGGGPSGVDLAGVARIFDRNRGAVTRFYVRGNDRTPDESRKITPGVPQVFFGWTEPSEVSLPPLARIPGLRKPVAEQAIARLEEGVGQAARAMAVAESFVADTKRRLAAKKPAVAPESVDGTDLPARLAMAPADVVKLFLPIVRIYKSVPLPLSVANAVLEHSRLTLEIQMAELSAHQAVWVADAWKYLEAPGDSEDTAGVASHKRRHEALALVAQRAQRQLALARAVEARFLAEHELKAATARAASGPERDETLAKAVAAATKKIELATRQHVSAEQASSQPPSPKYRGLSGSYGASSGRRLSLARWVADRRNPLTARVAVNHIWLRHFDRALVSTVFDFGLSGARPSHPQLLEWLAAELQQPSQVVTSHDGRLRWSGGKPKAVGPWSMKHLHRLIVTSRAYRSSSTPDEANLRIDPDNVLLWRMPPRRMDAETIRDSVLAAAGGLDRTLGGPDLPSTDGLFVPRRSLYFHHSPEDQMAFLRLFDGADPAECYQRHVSIVPHQALALFNSELTLVHSRRLARELSKERDLADSFIAAAFQQVLSRPVTASERAICRKFLAAREAVYTSGVRPASVTAADAKRGHAPSADPRLHARENLVHSLFNHHDFVTIK